MPAPRVAFRRRVLNPALYVEWTWPRGSYGAPEELEARLILERDFGDVRVVANPTLTRAWSGDESQRGTSVGLVAGIYERRFWVVQPGAELFWSMGSVGDWPAFRRQYFLLGPSADVNLTPALGVHVAADFGVTDGTDRLMVRGFLTYQFDTFRPSARQMSRTVSAPQGARPADRGVPQTRPSIQAVVEG